MIMKNITLLLLVSLTLLIFSCGKDDPTPPQTCHDIKFEITSSSATIDSVHFGVQWNSVDNDTRTYTNLTLPYSEVITRCKTDFDYYIFCHDKDTNKVVTLKIYDRGTLLQEKTGKQEFGTYSLGGGIND